MATSRQQTRARLRDVRQLGETLIRRGLPYRPAPGEVLAAGVALADRLAAKRAQTGALEFAAAAHALYEASQAAHPPKAALACKRGCNWCCYSTVAATVPEILLAAARRPPAPGPGSTAAPSEAGRPPPCLLLRTDGCTVYAARPMMCRVANSLDAAVCVEEYEGTNPERDVPVSQVPIDHGIAVRTAMLVALRLKGLDAGLYELASGLRECASDGDVGTRWLGGQPAFRRARELPVEASIRAMVDRLVIELGTA